MHMPPNTVQEARPTIPWQGAGLQWPWRSWAVLNPMSGAAISPAADPPDHLAALVDALQVAQAQAQAPPPTRTHAHTHTRTRTHTHKRAHKRAHTHTRSSENTTSKDPKKPPKKRKHKH